MLLALAAQKKKGRDEDNKRSRSTSATWTSARGEGLAARLPSAAASAGQADGREVAGVT